jgi:hypothetical protein
MPAKRRRAKAGVMWLDGLARLAAPLFVNNEAEAATFCWSEQMDKIDMKFLKRSILFPRSLLLVPSM